MGAFSDLGRAIAAFAEGAPPVRASVRDPFGGAEIHGILTEILSDTHVRLRCDDGLVVAVARADLTLLPVEEDRP